VHARPGRLSVIDGALEVDIRVRRLASRGTHGRDARSQVQPRSTEVELRLPPASRRVEDVVVKTHHARNHRVARSLDHLGTFRYLDIAARPDGSDPTSLDQDRLTRASRRACAIDNRRVLQGDDLGIDGDELADTLGQIGGRLAEKPTGAGAEKQERDEGRNENEREPDTAGLHISSPGRP
jgi:hypothetical protein